MLNFERSKNSWIEFLFQLQHRDNVILRVDFNSVYIREQKTLSTRSIYTWIQSSERAV